VLLFIESMARLGRLALALGSHWVFLHQDFIRQVLRRVMTWSVMKPCGYLCV
jgi:hypothetical protein